MSINLLDLRHLRVGTKTEIKAITNIRDGQFSLCTENRMMYTFVKEGASYGTPDDIKVLSSDVSSSSRWVQVNIDSPYGGVFYFQVSDWVDGGSEYNLTLLNSNVFNLKALLQVYDTYSNIVGVSNIGVDNSNNYVLTTCKIPDCRFEGKAVILPTNGI